MGEMEPQRAGINPCPGNTLQEALRTKSPAKQITRNLHASNMWMSPYTVVVRSSSIAILVVAVGFKTGWSCLRNSRRLKAIQTLIADSGQADVAFAGLSVEQSDVPHICRLGDTTWPKDIPEDDDKIIVTFRQTG
ncbi:hypothetical protein AAE478_002763 [Parahypoxylon ruwenzoriense]